MLRIRERQLNEEEDEVRDKRLKEAINRRPVSKPEEWVNHFKHNNSNKLKKHILNFFLVEGHLDIAKQFAQQANINQKQLIPNLNEKIIAQRYQIVKLIKQGQVDEALDKIHNYENGKMFDEIQDSGESPENKKQILFCLKSLKVINLIKEGKLQAAISHARKDLLPFTKHDIKYMARIQEIMSLLVFPNATECSNYYLMTPEYRSKIAKQVNTLLLSSESQGLQVSKNLNTKVSYDSISELLRLTKWIEKRLQKFLEFPKINLLSTESDQMFIPFSSR